jgi:hypothetical protein
MSLLNNNIDKNSIRHILTFINTLVWQKKLMNLNIQPMLNNKVESTLIIETLK